MADPHAKTSVWSGITGGLSGGLVAVSVGRLFTNAVPLVFLYAYSAVVLVCIWRLTTWGRRARLADARYFAAVASQPPTDLAHSLPDEDRRWVEEQMRLARGGDASGQAWINRDGKPRYLRNQPNVGKSAPSTSAGSIDTNQGGTTPWA